MMASIPNMRSTPLPVPTGKTGGAETAPGDFAAQMPALPVVPGLTGETPPALAELPACLVMPTPVVAEDDAQEVTAETPETKADTAEGTQPVPAVVIPFLPVQPAPQARPPVATGETVLTQGGDVAVEATGGKPARETGAAKTKLPLSANGDTPKDQAEAAPADMSRVEAAVKDLLQRKQGLTKAVAAPRTGSADGAKAEAASVQGQTQAQTQMPPQTQPQTPVTASTPMALPLMDQAQPALAPSATQPGLVRSEGAGPVAGTPTTDLAVERQLDLARDTEWLDRLARDIARAGASDTPLRFRLNPQTLGHLQVELQQGDRGTAVRLTVETEAARQILADAQPRLTAEARAQGVRIAETHVDLSGSGRHAPGDQRRQDETQTSPMIRTARGAGEDAVASARPSRRDRLDRYA